MGAEHGSVPGTSRGDGEIFQAPESFHTTEYEFPTDPGGRLGAIASSFNAATKTVTFLTLDETLTSPKDLKDTFRTIFAGSEIDRFKGQNAQQYCHKTLCPIGLVAEEATISVAGVYDEIVGYRLTDAGVQYGQPAAAAFLDFEYRNGVSVYPILGTTHSPSESGARAPLMRTQILRVLAEGQSTASALAYRFGVDAAIIGKHLERLAQAGAVAYTSVHSQTGITQVAYALGSVPLDEVEPVGREMVFTEQVVHACRELAADERAISQRNVYAQLPESVNRTPYLENRINRVLSGLTEQGVLDRGDFTGSKQHSKATLTPWGQTVVDELLDPLWDALADGHTLEQWRYDVLPRVRADLAEYAQTAGDLYYPYSNSARLQRRAEYLAEITSALGEDGYTVYELATRLKIPNLTARTYLNTLLKKRTIRAEKGTGGVTYYYLNPDNE